MDVAALIHEVRESEQWVLDVKSLYLRMEGRWKRTPESIARHVAEIGKRSPDATVDEKAVQKQRVESSEVCEMAFEQNRIGDSLDSPGHFQTRKVWDGAQFALMQHDQLTGDGALGDRRRGHHQLPLFQSHRRTLRRRYPLEPPGNSSATRG